MQIGLVADKQNGSPVWFNNFCSLSTVEDEILIKLK